ncbi:hypothetical protein [Ligilactobacillus salivarius]|jgi:hypothetical protein|uniref:hypothetical protein n=1 Tax=Ligilactobacillus salivarius TaxID=1624 RepID=UPI00136FB514|nr:hypothetical protein [Ligilactobacillus salivarius]MYV10570.1 hypothetical protein [Ligilactobacillus salivarius]
MYGQEFYGGLFMMSFVALVIILMGSYHAVCWLYKRKRFIFKLMLFIPYTILTLLLVGIKALNNRI